MIDPDREELMELLDPDVFGTVDEAAPTGDLDALRANLINVEDMEKKRPQKYENFLQGIMAATKPYQAAGAASYGGDVGAAVPPHEVGQVQSKLAMAPVFDMPRHAMNNPAKASLIGPGLTAGYGTAGEIEDARAQLPDKPLSAFGFGPQMAGEVIPKTTYIPETQAGNVMFNPESEAGQKAAMLGGIGIDLLTGMAGAKAPKVLSKFRQVAQSPFGKRVGKELGYVADFAKRPIQAGKRGIQYLFGGGDDVTAPGVFRRGKIKEMQRGLPGEKLAEGARITEKIEEPRAIKLAEEASELRKSKGAITSTREARAKTALSEKQARLGAIDEEIAAMRGGFSEDLEAGVKRTKEFARANFDETLRTSKATVSKEDVQGILDRGLKKASRDIRKPYKAEDVLEAEKYHKEIMRKAPPGDLTVDEARQFFRENLKGKIDEKGRTYAKVAEEWDDYVKKMKDPDLQKANKTYEEYMGRIDDAYVQNRMGDKNFVDRAVRGDLTDFEMESFERSASNIKMSDEQVKAIKDLRGKRQRVIKEFDMSKSEIESFKKGELEKIDEMLGTNRIKRAALTRRMKKMRNRLSQRYAGREAALQKRLDSFAGTILRLAIYSGGIYGAGKIAGKSISSVIEDTGGGDVGKYYGGKDGGGDN